MRLATWHRRPLGRVSPYRLGVTIDRKCPTYTTEFRETSRGSFRNAQIIEDRSFSGDAVRQWPDGKRWKQASANGNIVERATPVQCQLRSRTAVDENEAALTSTSVNVDTS